METKMACRPDPWPKLPAWPNGDLIRTAIGFEAKSNGFWCSRCLVACFQGCWVIFRPLIVIENGTTSSTSRTNKQSRMWSMMIDAVLKPRDAFFTSYSPYLFQLVFNVFLRLRHSEFPIKWGKTDINSLTKASMTIVSRLNWKTNSCKRISYWPPIAPGHLFSYAYKCFHATFHRSFGRVFFSFWIIF